MKLSVNAHCSDLCNVSIYDDNGKELIEVSGYVPRDLGIGGGDDVYLEIDVESGKILNWDKNKQTMLAWIEEIKEKREYQLYQYTKYGRSMNRLWKGNLAELQDKFDTQLTDLYDLQEFLEPKGYFVELIT